MKVVFVRHGESASNARIPCDDFAAIPLTAKGEQQARECADAWLVPPTLIVHSPFLRAEQTAAPTIARFSHVCVEVWPIQEFTNLHARRWKAEDPTDKYAEERRQWNVCDPDFFDGDHTESFRGFQARSSAALELLASMPDDALVYAFTHGFFMHSVRRIVADPHLDVQQRMRAFVPLWNEAPIENVSRIAFEWSGKGWTLFEPRTLACI